MPGISDTGGQRLGVSCPNILSIYVYLGLGLGAGGCQLDWRDQQGGEKNPWG